MARPTNSRHTRPDGTVIAPETRDRWAAKVAAGTVTRAEAAIACGVSIRTIDRWVEARRQA